MPTYQTQILPEIKTATAPDGSEVRVLAEVTGGGMAHFRLSPGQISRAVQHRTVEEIWYVVKGAGQMWRAQDDKEEIINLRPNMALTVPLGTRFQFRASGEEPLDIVGVTMPPWPGPGEALIVYGPWEPNSPYPEAERRPLVKLSRDHVKLTSRMCGSVIEILRDSEFSPNVAVLEDVRPTIGHYHQHFDEVYLVLDGTISLQLFEPRESALTQIALERFELCVIPRGVHHRIPLASERNILCVLCMPQFNANDEHYSAVLNELLRNDGELTGILNKL